MKVTVNPRYQNLAGFIQALPQAFYTGGKVVYKARNEIKVFDEQGFRVNVKAYRVPNLINRIAYGFFRPSKARRAYKHALIVQERGFDTPTPFGYIEEKKGGLLARSFFISEQCPYTRNMIEFCDGADWKPKADILVALAKYTAKLHENEIYHLDFSVGNILFEKAENGSIRFSLIDINRMKFMPVDMDMGCKNFQRLRGGEGMFELLGREYAKARGFNEEECVRLTVKYNREHVEAFIRHREFKRKWLGKKKK